MRNRETEPSPTSGLGTIAERILRTAGRGVRLLWLQFGIALIMLAGLEVIVQAYQHVHGARRYDDYRAEADAYKGAPWAKEVLREYNQRTMKWQPYVYWVGAPFDGEYTHVDAEGNRATWRSPQAGRVCAHPVRIFMFGGSTMWGEGARDDDTIASWLQRMLSARHSCAVVTNFGQDGYVSTQEMLLLDEQIRKGTVPDLAIFYDGYNDANSAFVNDEAGVTYDESARRREFNLGNLVTPVKWGQLATHWKIMLEVTVKEIARALSISSFARHIAAKLSPDSYRNIDGVLVRIPVRESKAVKDSALESAAARDYLANVKIIESLAANFSFRCAFYWQPWLGNKLPLSAYERQQMKDLLPMQEAFMRSVRERVAEGDVNKEIHFLSDAFSNQAQPFFIDEVHISGQGNRLIAARMLPEVMTMISEIGSNASRKMPLKQPERNPSS
jgi:lysophospholipase L1-like esterase